MRKIKLIFTTVLLIIAAVLILNVTTNKRSVWKPDLSEQIYSYMKNKNNQKKVFEGAIALNDGNSANACVYFISEVLRKNNVNIPKETCNTAQILSILQQRGWKKDTNYKNLEPGDIAFTTDEQGNKNGVPSHTYVFMGWVKEGSYDYAYICDNQAKDYENKIYHIRNIKERENINGIEKDAFSFFMKAS